MGTEDVEEISGKSGHLDYVESLQNDLRALQRMLDQGVISCCRRPWIVWKQSDFRANPQS